MDLPTAGGARNFPVKVFRGRSETRTAMQVHFLHRHFWDTMIMLEDGNLSHPWCPQCDMLVTCKALNMEHVTTAQFAKGGGTKETEAGGRGDVGERG